MGALQINFASPWSQVKLCSNLFTFVQATKTLGAALSIQLGDLFIATSCPIREYLLTYYVHKWKYQCRTDLEFVCFGLSCISGYQCDQMAGLFFQYMAHSHQWKFEANNSIFAKESSKFCKILYKPSKMAKDLWKNFQSGEMSPNLATQCT